MASSSSLALSTLLSALHTHLNAQTQLLPTLHAQLGLPATSLEDELQTLQHTLTRAVESQIEVRMKQVEEWEVKCKDVEIGCSRYSKALGTHAKVAGSLNEIKSEKVLPRRYERATEYQEKLRQVYHTKLEQLTTLTSRLAVLSRTLGATYFPADVLQPSLAPDETPDDAKALRDVMPERFSKLEKELVRGKGEVTKRLAQLGDVFLQIDWLYTELGMDPPEYSDTPPGPVASSSTLAVPPFLLPRASSSCGMRNLNTDPACEYHRTFSRFVQLLDSAGSDPVPATLLGSIGVEPTQGILLWAEKLCMDLEDTKKRRETHIQAMYDQLEALWRRMGVDDKAMDGFVEANRGTTSQVIQAYEEELERMIDLKRERMGEFIANARMEIQSLWEELMTGEEERAEFAAFSDDEHTEDLLSQHEHEIARLKAEVRLKTPLLTPIRKYFEICEEEKELERVAGDQTRLLGRGGGRDPGRLLREEKMRKRVGKEKPKLEQQLLSLLPAWEQKHGRPFLVHGESILHILMENVSANEQENKKKAPVSQYSVQALNKGSAQGPKPSNVVPSGPGRAGYVPGKSHQPSAGTVTPAIRPGSSMAQNQGMNKRQRLVDGSSQIPTRSTSPMKGRSTRSTSRGAPSNAPQAAPPMPQSTKHSQGYATLGWGRAPSTLQRTTSGGTSNRSTSSTLSSSISTRYVETSRSCTGGSLGASVSRQSSQQRSSRMKRESFKPRPSIDGLGTNTGWRGNSFKAMPLTEEE
ncbi:microtubule associated protein-domain-containing protein [Scleroderma citrinum]